MSELQRIVRFLPAYDKRAQGYGIHGAEIIFALTDGKRAITFAVYTDWDLPSVEKRRSEFTRGSSGAMITYHDSKPHWPDQRAEPGCAWTGGDCYCDSSGLAASDLFNRLVAEGDAAVWAVLQEWWDAKIERAES